MSLKLNGSTSGYVEIDAPAVAGSTFITLPSTSGGEFIVTDSAGDLNVNNGTLFVDASSQRVGIGTTTPGSALEVKPSSSLSNIGIQAGTINSDSIRLQAGGTVNTYLEYRGYLGHAWFVDSTERARIDSSGTLLIGTSTGQGSSLLQVEGTSSSDLVGADVFLRRGALPSVNGAGLGFIYFGDNVGNQGAVFGASAEAAWTSGSSHPTRLVFSTTANGQSSPTERMRISSSGQIYTFSSDFGAKVAVSAAAGTTVATFIGGHSATVNTGGTNSFIVWSNGNVVNTNNSYGAISDIKLKENIVDANSQWDDLKALKVRNYNFKEGQTHTQIGLIAQEVELVSPGLVSESPDLDEDGNDLGTTTKSVNYSVLYMKAVKALQEAMERIETLEAKVAALEAS